MGKLKYNEDTALGCEKEITIHGALYSAAGYPADNFTVSKGG